MTAIDWQPDVLADPYEQCVIDLGDDPDGEGHLTSAVVRRRFEGTPRAAVLYVHGYTDYFFQTEFADFFAARDIAFYSVDLRKCGRSLRDHHTPHYVSDLALYDTELDEALRIVREETDAPVVIAAHSTGGLIVPLWLDRTHPEGVVGELLNSPWLDLQGAAWTRGIGTEIVRGISLLRPKLPLPLPESDAYGAGIHQSRSGEWDYDLTWKPINGFPVTAGWLYAVRRGHAVLHRGIDVGVPSLVLRSGETRFAMKYSDRLDDVDAVLDVTQISRWAGCLGGRIEIVPIVGARHDVFLSKEPVRKVAYGVLDRWLTDLLGWDR